MNNQSFRPGGFSILPPIVKNLLIINVLCFLGYITMDVAFQVNLNDILGLHYFLSDEFSPFQYVSYMFMHGGISHLFFNMFALWMFGNALENYWGAKRFLIYYMVTGIGAAIIHTIVISYGMNSIMDEINLYIANPDSVEPSQEFIRYYLGFYNDVYYKVPTYIDPALLSDCKGWILNQPVVVGASGAVFGLLLAFGMLFPNALIYLYFAIPIKAKYFVMLYGALELYSGIQNAAGDNVAHFAHLGGMLFGFGLIKYWGGKNNFKL